MLPVITHLSNLLHIKLYGYSNFLILANLCLLLLLLSSVNTSHSITSPTLSFRSFTISIGIVARSELDVVVVFDIRQIIFAIDAIILLFSFSVLLTNVIEVFVCSDDVIVDTHTYISTLKTEKNF